MFETLDASFANRWVGQPKMVLILPVSRCA
jgi:hypothetical protein